MKIILRLSIHLTSFHCDCVAVTCDVFQGINNENIQQQKHEKILWIILTEQWEAYCLFSSTIKFITFINRGEIFIFLRKKLFSCTFGFNAWVKGSIAFFSAVLCMHAIWMCEKNNSSKQICKWVKAQNEHHVWADVKEKKKSEKVGK